jgi:hypothetical protein
VKNLWADYTDHFGFLHLVQFRITSTRNTQVIERGAEHIQTLCSDLTTLTVECHYFDKEITLSKTIGPGLENYAGHLHSLKILAYESLMYELSVDICKV